MGSQKFIGPGRKAAASSRVFGAILAAGRSSRFGTPKALASCGGLTLLEHIASTLSAGGCHTTFAIVDAPHADLIRRNLPREFRLHHVAPHTARGMLGSFRTALHLAQTEGADALIVALLDQPHVRPHTIAQLIAASGMTSDNAGTAVAIRVVPVHLGRAGHPFLVHPQQIDFAILDGNPPRTLREALRGCGPRLEINVNDEGILDDLDTPADAARLRIFPFRLAERRFGRGYMASGCLTGLIGTHVTSPIQPTWYPAGRYRWRGTRRVTNTLGRSAWV